MQIRRARFVLCPRRSVSITKTNTSHFLRLLQMTTQLRFPKQLSARVV